MRVVNDKIDGVSSIVFSLGFRASLALWRAARLGPKSELLNGRQMTSDRERLEEAWERVSELESVISEWEEVQDIYSKLEEVCDQLEQALGKQLDEKMQDAFKKISAPEQEDGLSKLSDIFLPIAGRFVSGQVPDLDTLPGMLRRIALLYTELRSIEGHLR